jgi:hypothetical protein
VSSLDFQNLRKHASAVHEADVTIKWDRHGVIAGNPDWAIVFDKNTRLIINAPPLLSSFVSSCPNRVEHITGYKCNHCGDVLDTYNKCRVHFKQKQEQKTPCPLHVGRQLSITSDIMDCVKIRHTCRYDSNNAFCLLTVCVYKCILLNSSSIRICRFY